MNFFKPKYDGMYMCIAQSAAQQSVALKRKVGCAIVTEKGLVSIGFNGMPSGASNVCEMWVNNDPPFQNSRRMTSKPEVIHAEINALSKLEHVEESAKGCSVFITTAPCINCAKSLAAVGVSRVVYLDAYKNADGITFLEQQNIKVEKYDTSQR